MRILHIVGAYVNFQLTLNDENLCLIQLRGEEDKYISIQQAHINFMKIPWVSGCGGIIESYVFDTQTREKEYLK